MCSRAEKVVCSVSWRDLFSADFSQVSFSTTTRHYTQNARDRDSECNGLFSTVEKLGLLRQELCDQNWAARYTEQGYYRPLQMENDRDGIWIIGADAKTTYANERMAEILGTSPSEMVGRESFAYVFPEDVGAAQRLFDSKTRGDAKPFHFRLRRKDGSPVWVDVQGTPLYNAAAVFRGIVGTFSVSNSEPS